MAKRKVSGPLMACKGSNRQTDSKPQVKKKQTKPEKKASSKAVNVVKSAVQDEELTPAEVIPNGTGRRSGRSAKLQAVKKMATMQEDIKTTDDCDDEDDVSLDVEYDEDGDDEEDEDDFEATLSTQKGSNKKQNRLFKGKLKSQDTSQKPGEGLTTEVQLKEKKVEERYLCQASQDQFLSLSESDSSSEDEDIKDSSKMKHSSSKSFTDKCKTANITLVAADKSKLETSKQLPESHPLKSADSAPKSMFDDLDDIPDLDSSQPGKVRGCTKSLFDDVDKECDQGEIRTCEEETVVEPVVTSQYFSKGNESGTPDHKNLKKGQTLKEKIRLNDARVPVKSTHSNGSEKLEEDVSEFEGTSVKSKEQIRKGSTKGSKQAAKIKETTNEKQTQKADHASALPPTSKKRERAVNQSTVSETSVLKTENMKRGGKGGQPDMEDDVERPAKKRKLSPTEMKNFAADTNKKSGRGKAKGRNENKVEVDKMEVDVKEGDADNAKRTGRGKSKGKNEPKRETNEKEIGVKEEDANTVKKDGRRSTLGKKEAKTDTDQMDNDVKEKDAKTVKKAGKRKIQGTEQAKTDIDQMGIDVKEKDANTVKKTGRKKTQGMKETKTDTDQMDIDVKEKDAKTVKKAVRRKTQGMEETKTDTDQKDVDVKEKVVETVKKSGKRKSWGKEETKTDTDQIGIDDVKKVVETVKKAGRRKTQEKEETKTDTEQMDVTVKEKVVETAKKAGREKAKGRKESTMETKKEVDKMEVDLQEKDTGTIKKAGRRKANVKMKETDADTVKKVGKGKSWGKKEIKKETNKMETDFKKEEDAPIKKFGRGKTKGKKETKMEVDVKEEEEEAADMSSDDSHSDWEEVEDTPMNELGEPTLTPKKEAKVEEMSLEIDIDLPGTSKAGKKKKREYNWANYFQWQVNKYNKERQLLLHKAHLVLLLASGFHSNKICNKMELQCLALSVIPTDILSKRPKQLNINYLTKILGWFKNCFKIRTDVKEDMTSSLDCILPARFEKRQAASERELVHMFAIILRCLGADVRLIFSLQPLTFKAKKLTKKFKSENANKEAPVKKPPPQSSPQEQRKGHLKESSSCSDGSSSKSVQSPSKSSSSKSSNGASKMKSTSSNIKMTSTQCAPKAQSTSSNSKAASSKAVHNQGKDRTPPGKALKEKKAAAKKTPEGTMRSERSEHSVMKEGEKQQIASGRRQVQKRALRAKNNSKRAVASKVSQSSDEEEDEEDGWDDDDYSDYEEELRKSASKRKSAAKRKSVMSSAKGSSKKKSRMTSSSSVSSSEELSADSDFEVEVVRFTKRPMKTETKKDGNKKKASRKILSSDSSEENVMLVDVLDPGSDCWLEVYLSSEKRWVCVDCVRSLINKPEMCEKQATNPITYVIGVENDGCVKDLTRRYASKWMTETHKLRPVDEWWEETLKPYSSNKERDRKEDSDTQDNLTSKPLPTSVAEYKNHPLYALKRHLLKFEALYPESAAILGYCRGEAVYSRECVHTLHTRETWMKEGKAIRIGEKPYKMVKPRPKWKKGEGIIKTEEATLGIFGVWQVEDYIPPPAVDGKVPRNEYGNVELFKPTMLPAGTVHLKIPGLNKIARKLDIDCVPAMMGWDFHSGVIHPVMDGFVVCEEHAEVLVAAWEEDKAEQERKEKEKREARAMNHWKLFIKSLLIRERLKERYDPNSASAGTSQQSEKDGRKDTSPVKASWPENKMTAFTGDEGNLLPFEKKTKKTKKKR